MFEQAFDELNAIFEQLQPAEATSSESSLLMQSDDRNSDQRDQEELQSEETS